jgi:hypothetical protein
MPPIFRDDKRVVALQAADMLAGWTRRLEAAAINGEPMPSTVWSERGAEVRRLNWEMNRTVAEEFFHTLNGYWKPKITYSFGGYDPF